jgi:hypothetical protein
MLMNAVIIGVSDRSILWRHGKIKEEEYDKFVKETAEFLAQHFDNVIITPDDGVYTDIALEFGKIKGKKPIAFYPDKDTFYGIEHIKPNFPKYDLKPIEGDWYKLDAEISKLAMHVFCFGFSPGSLIELCFLKYHQKYGARKDPKLKDIKLFIDERCIKEKLPKSIEEQINNLKYFDHFSPDML